MISDNLNLGKPLPPLSDNHLSPAHSQCGWDLWHQLALAAHSQERLGSWEVWACHISEISTLSETVGLLLCCDAVGLEFGLDALG